MHISLNLNWLFFCQENSIQMFLGNRPIFAGNFICLKNSMEWDVTGFSSSNIALHFYTNLINHRRITNNMESWVCDTNEMCQTSPDGCIYTSLQWRHNERGSISNHQRFHCLLNCWLKRRSKKTSKFCITGLCAWKWPVNFTHKGPVTWKLFPFDDVIMS